MKEQDKIQAEKTIKYFFDLLNINLPADTPKRYTNMILELTEYQNISNIQIAEKLDKIFPINSQTNSKNIVLVKDIGVFSLCEHHVALMYDMKISVAYIPNQYVIGLSKISRMCEMVCKRLQLQERIGTDILEVMKLITLTNDIGVCIKAKHSCVTARGVRNINAETITTHFSGKFLEEDNLKNYFTIN